MNKFTYGLAALVILQTIVVFVCCIQSIRAFQIGYDAAIQSAELVEMDGNGYVLRFGDDAHIHEYWFEEVA